MSTNPARLSVASRSAAAHTEPDVLASERPSPHHSSRRYLYTSGDNSGHDEFTTAAAVTADTPRLDGHLLAL